MRRRCRSKAPPRGGASDALGAQGCPLDGLYQFLDVKRLGNDDGTPLGSSERWQQLWVRAHEQAGVSRERGNANEVLDVRRSLDAMIDQHDARRL